MVDWGLRCNLRHCLDRQIRRTASVAIVSLHSIFQPREIHTILLPAFASGVSPSGRTSLSAPPTAELAPSSIHRGDKDALPILLLPRMPVNLLITIVKLYNSSSAPSRRGCSNLSLFVYGVAAAGSLARGSSRKPSGILVCDWMQGHRSAVNRLGQRGSRAFNSHGCKDRMEDIRR